MAGSRKKQALGWTASLAMVGALGLAACGGDNDDAADTVRTADVASASGSDEHLYNQAADAARSAGRATNGSDVRLENQAAEIAAAGIAARDEVTNMILYGGMASSASSASGSDVHLENQAADAAERESANSVNGSDVHLSNQAAEAAERGAKLDNAADTYADDEAQDTSSDEYVPGTRHMPAR
jgi:hypothetical protein